MVVRVGVKGDTSSKGAQEKMEEVFSLFHILLWWWIHDPMCLSKLIELYSKGADFFLHINYIPVPKAL